MFEMIINLFAERIELLVIVRLYYESENNIYLMRNKCLRVSICVCRSVCAENLEKAFGDFDFVFGETVMPGKTSRHKNIVQQEGASQTIIERWQTPQST